MRSPHEKFFGNGLGQKEKAQLDGKHLLAKLDSLERELKNLRELFRRYTARL